MVGKLPNGQFSYNSFVLLITWSISMDPFVLFDLILYVPSTIFQLYRDGSSWDEPVLS